MDASAYDNVWVVGTDGNIWVYNGHTLQHSHGPSDEGRRQLVEGVGPEIWSLSFGKRVHHYDGADWSVTETDPVDTLRNVASVGPGRLAAITRSLSADDELLEFDGAQWQSIPAPFPTAKPWAMARDVDGSLRVEIFKNDWLSSQTYRWVDGSWTGDPVDSHGLTLRGSPGGVLGFVTSRGTGPGQNVAEIFRSTSLGWATLGKVDSYVHDLWSAEGTTLAATEMGLMQEQNGQWSAVPALSDYRWDRVRGTRANDIWAVGSPRNDPATGMRVNPKAIHSAIAHFDGVRWQVLDAQMSSAPADLAVTASDIWVLGSGGALLRRER